MNISKYLTNKDITLTNDDLDIDKLTADLRKGYELSSGVDKKIQEAVNDANKTSKVELTDLQNRYDEIEKRNTDLASKIKTVSLERTMVEHGFTKDQFEEVSKMRTSLFENEADDDKAISQIKEKFKDTYFPKPIEEKPPVKDDLPLNDGRKEPEPIKVSRTTSIKDIVKK